MDEKKLAKNFLPSNISAVRYMINEAHPSNAIFLNGYEEAKCTENAVVIMEGDYGGQIYIVCPMKSVKCDKVVLEMLLDALDEIAWKCNKGAGKGIYYEVKNIGDGVAGGMGGGSVIHGIWMHKEFKEKGYEEKIKEVIDGTRTRI